MKCDCSLKPKSCTGWRLGHKERSCNCNMQRRKWASFAVAVCARVRFMSWITAKSLSGNVAQTNDRNINGCEMRLKDHKRHKIKDGKVKATVYGSLNRSSCQTTTILAQNTRLSTPSAFGVETRLDDGHLNALSIVRELYIWMENLWKLWNVLAWPTKSWF